QPPPQDCCALPGVTVVTDPAGDAAAGGSTQHDITSISMAGLMADPGMPPSKLIVTMKVDNLNSPPPSSSWKTRFTAPSGTIYYVEMNTFDPTQVQFKYGTFTPGTPGNFNEVGDADAGSFSADGTIEI